VRPSMFIAVTIASFALSATSLFAAEGERFAIEKTKYGFVRLDKATGAMTFCRENDETLDCAPAVTAKDSVETDVEALGKRIEALETRLKASEDYTKTLEGKLDTATHSPKFMINGENRLPTDKEVDDAFSFMEKIMKRFMDMNHELDQDQGLPKKT